MANFLREHLTFDQAGMVVETAENSNGGKDLYLKGPLHGLSQDRLPDRPITHLYSHHGVLKAFST